MTRVAALDGAVVGLAKQGLDPMRSYVIALLVWLALLPSSVNAQPRQEARAVVLGYYVPYDTTSWQSLVAHLDQVDIVAAQWVSIDACGQLSSRDDQTLKQILHSRGVAVVPSLFTASAGLNHRVLTDETARATAIESIVDYTTAEGYDGFDVDLEGIDPADRDPFTDFVADLGTQLHDRGKLVTLALPAKDRDVKTGWAGAFDYAALGPAADLVTIMAYEYSGPFSGPGSVAPYAWVSGVVAFAASQIPPEKLALGLAFYGYDWNITSGGATSLGYSAAMRRAEHFQAEQAFASAEQSLTFTYTAESGDRVPPAPAQASLGHTITSRTAPPCDAAPPSSAPTPTRAPRPAPAVPQAHAVWLEESGSAAARLSLVEAYHLRGVATWRLGLEDPGVWPLFQRWREGDQGV
jgi:spore germination protein